MMFASAIETRPSTFQSLSTKFLSQEEVSEKQKKGQPGTRLGHRLYCTLELHYFETDCLVVESNKATWKCRYRF